MTDKPVKVSQDIIDMARGAKSFAIAAADDDTPPPSDELFIRAAVAFSMLMRMADIAKEMAVIVAGLDRMTRDHAIALIASNFSDSPPSTPERAVLFATVLPDDYGQALQEAVAGNRRVLGRQPHHRHRSAIREEAYLEVWAWLRGFEAGSDSLRAPRLPAAKLAGYPASFTSLAAPASPLEALANEMSLGGGRACPMRAQHLLRAGMKALRGHDFSPDLKAAQAAEFELEVEQEELVTARVGRR